MTDITLSESSFEVRLGDRLSAARAKLTAPETREISPTRALGAAALAAISALTLAAAVILGPGVDDGGVRHTTAVEGR